MKNQRSLLVIFFCLFACVYTTSGFTHLYQKPKPKPIPAEVKEILDKHGCIACHRPTHRVIGPPFSEIALRKYSAEEMAELIAKPKPENWPGYAKMISIKDVPLRDIIKIKAWMETLDEKE